MTDAADARVAMVFERVVAISSTHPSLPGHFPARPIVPGVVVLDRVRTALEEALAGASLAAIDHAKFHAPVLPGHRFRITLERKGEDRIDFVCRDDEHETTLVSGQLRVRYAPLAS